MKILTIMGFQNLQIVSMNKSKCPICVSSHTIKYGNRNGVQTYKCNECGYRFRNARQPSGEQIWMLYHERKQTISELAETYNVSESTIKRRLREVTVEWHQPKLCGEGFVHLDATYWGHNWGVMLALDEASGKPLYLEFIRNETVADYQAAVSSIENRGYKIKGIIIDGKQTLFKAFAAYRIQMCQYHMKQIVRRYLTLHPKLKASRALKDIMDRIATATKDEFVRDYEAWKSRWYESLHKRSHLKNGQTPYRHRTLRSAMHSVDFYLPYLFTYQEPDCKGMPNTNNKIEGTFTDLKKNLNNHSGMSLMNRKRFISGFFLALVKTLSIEKEEPTFK